jgi:nonribosomal peptide synthetase CepB
VDELAGWTAVVEGAEPFLTRPEQDHSRATVPAEARPPVSPAAPETATATRRVSAEVSPGVTGALLTTVPAVFHGGVNDVLLAGLAAAVSEWRSRRGAPRGPVLVDVEGHGREPLTAGLDLSRTVGWLTSVHPVRLDPGPEEAAGIRAGGPAAGRVVKQVKEQLRAVPGDGLGYGLLRHLNPDTGPKLAALPSAQIGFNYLGRLTTGSRAGSDAGDGSAPSAPPHDRPTRSGGIRHGRRDGAPTWRQLGLGGDVDDGLMANHALEVSAVVRDGPDGPSMRLVVSWPGDLMEETAAQDLAAGWRDMLHGLAEHAAHPGAGGHTPSDFLLTGISQADIGELETEWRNRK